MEKIILREENEVGVTWFIPDVEFVEGVPCTGVIREMYEEGSVYEGRGEYDGKDFFRQGYGVQDFQDSYLTGNLFGAAKELRAYKFVGNFDRNLSGWMYGNGILYFTDKEGKPSAFAKGFFKASTDVMEWRGNFDTDLLMPGFTPDMECKLLRFAGVYDRLIDKYKDVKDVDYVFFGDSWAEVWTNSQTMGSGPNFDEEVKTYGLNAINVGIGGTKYCEWCDIIHDLVICHNPKYVSVNLGFNDIHGSSSPEMVFAHFKKIVKILKDALPDVKIYVNSVCHCTPFSHMFDKETAYNKLVEDYANSVDYITYIPVNKLFMKDGKPIENMDDYCIADHFHLKRKGYDIWAKKVLETIKNNK